MRIDVKKVLIVGMHNDREHFFKKAQEVGLVHFIKEGPVSDKEVPSEISNMAAAIKVLRGLPTMEQEEVSEFALADGTTSEILHLRDFLEKLQEEKRVIKLEIARVEVFGDFSLEDIAYIEKEGDRKVLFFCSKKGIINEGNASQELIWIGSDHGLDYFIAICPKHVNFNHMIEMHIELPLGKLKQRLEQIQREIHEKEHALKAYARFNHFLHTALIDKMNKYSLLSTQNYAQLAMEGSLFAVEGWIPVDRFEDLKRVIEPMYVHVEEIAVEPQDVPPTYLENEGINRIGEDLVQIYDTPSNTDKDPSLWVLAFFSFFFGIIVCDAGYGLIFLGLAIFLKWKFTDVNRLGKRIQTLFLILSFSCVAWGVLMNSYFGISLDINSPVRDVSLLQWLVDKKAAYHIQHEDATYTEWVEKYPGLKNVKAPREFLAKGIHKFDGQSSYEIQDQFSDNILMELSLLIGMIHIILSFLRYLGRNWSGIGWIACIIGGYLYFPEYLHATSILHFVFGLNRTIAATQGLYLMYGGIFVAVLLAIIRHRLFGILELMNVIQVFSDILSYLRLYALGLAGAIVGATLNELAGSVALVAGIILVVLGHGVNIVLAVMSGVIHGLRLNFLEWYHYSFEGGGKKFTPLRKMDLD